MLIVAFARSSPQQFAENIDTMTLVSGGIAYGFIFAMAATSFDRTAAWIGARRWKLLHAVGSCYIWFIFLMTFAMNASSDPRYWSGVALLAAVMVLRIVARWARWRRTSEAPQLVG
jgi:DMSO/TMAO reductase YedYZ heme-binding membrane subunit